MTRLLYTLAGFAIYFVAVTAHAWDLGIDGWGEP